MRLLISCWSSLLSSSKPPKSSVLSIFLVVARALVSESKIQGTWYHCFIIPPSSLNGLETSFPIRVELFSIFSLHVLHFALPWEAYSTTKGFSLSPSGMMNKYENTRRRKEKSGLLLMRWRLSLLIAVRGDHDELFALQRWQNATARFNLLLINVPPCFISKLEVHAGKNYTTAADLVLRLHKLQNGRFIRRLTTSR